MTRREFLTTTLAVAPVAMAGCIATADDRAQGGNERRFEITRTDAEWRRVLTSRQYSVLREHDTERPGSSALNNEQRAGTYHCAGCDLPLYGSTAKYDSGTGWPSFTAPLPNAVGTAIDRSLLGVRTEVHCRRCGGHLGHVFPDGPPPTGERHCINGDALVFRSSGVAS